MNLFVECFVVFLTIFISFTLYIKWKLQHWKRKNIPFLEPKFLFGNLKNPLTVQKSLAQHFQEFYWIFKKKGVKCGGIYQFYSPSLLVIDPADIRQILVKDFQYFRDRGFYNDGRGRKNLVTIEGEKWTILREKFAPMFASGRMKSMFNLMVDASKLLENYVDDHVASGKVLDLKDTIGRSVMNFIAIYVFGIECNTFDDTTFYKMLKHAVSGTEPFLRMTFCNAFPKLARFLRISFFSDKSLRFITDSVERTVRYRIQHGVIKNDFVQMAMELMNNNTMNMDGLKAHCLLFFVGGYDAIANVTTFLLAELALNRDVQQRLRDEIDKTLAEYDGRLTYEGVMKMKYLEMVVCETLRKYPAIPYLNRKCVKDYKLPSSGIGIEQGTAMIISNYALHNDPEYFPNPNKFDPERFSEENKSKIVPHTYLPFGEGPRFCIGDRFAKLKIKTIAVNFVRKYRFKLHKMIQTPLVFNPTGLFTTAAEDILFDIENSVK